MAAAAIALASCSSEDVIEVNNGNAIDFRVTMGTETNSRGVETTTNNLGKFYITAVNNSSLYFHDELFTSSGSNYTSASTYYYPGDKSPVNFYAYSYATESNLTSLDSDLANATINATTQKIDFTPAAKPENQLDLVTATGSGSSATSGAVSLQFGHALSQIQIQAKNSNSNYTYEVTGIKIANVKPTGVYDFTSGWTSSGTATSYTVDYAANTSIILNGTAQDLTGLTTTNNTGAMLIPQQLTAWKNSKTDTGTYLAVNVKITTSQTGYKVHDGYACVGIGTNWEPGKCYIYILDFTDGAGYTEEGEPILGGAIKFTANVSAWTEYVEEGKTEPGINVPM